MLRIDSSRARFKAELRLPGGIGRSVKQPDKSAERDYNYDNGKQAVQGFARYNLSPQRDDPQN
jgi:hypothetical protein